MSCFGRFIRVGVVLSIVTAMAAPPVVVSGQQTVIRAQVNLVNILFTAFDKKGKHVAGLTKKDIEVYEDGVKQTIEFFSKPSESQTEPLTLAMLVDASGSVRDKLAVEQMIASDFLKDVLQPKRDLASILSFGEDVELIQDFTSDLGRLDNALHSVKPGGSTALYDAILLASEQHLNAEAGRKVIVILSDGEDTSSRTTRKEAIEAAQKSDVTVFSIGVKSDFGSDWGALRECARETGGRFFEAKVNAQQISNAFQEILNIIKQQYNVSYYSSNPKKDGSFRRVQVRVMKDNVRVQHRSGYYAPRA
ncbi:MAG TPA: VWA domain-containing protein [Acidobacteriota bacterium]|jgi:Ca-activated chloride channel family protein